MYTSDGKCYVKNKAGNAQGEKGSGQVKSERRHAGERESRQIAREQEVQREKSKCKVPRQVRLQQGEQGESRRRSEQRGTGQPAHVGAYRSITEAGFHSGWKTPIRGCGLS